jgi:hypothetical protein
MPRYHSFGAGVLLSLKNGWIYRTFGVVFVRNLDILYGGFYFGMARNTFE